MRRRAKQAAFFPISRRSAASAWCVAPAGRLLSLRQHNLCAVISSCAQQLPGDSAVVNTPVLQHQCRHISTLMRTSVVALGTARERKVTQSAEGHGSSGGAAGSKTAKAVSSPQKSQRRQPRTAAAAAEGKPAQSAVRIHGASGEGVIHIDVAAALNEWAALRVRGRASLTSSGTVASVPDHSSGASGGAAGAMLSPPTSARVPLPSARPAWPTSGADVSTAELAVLLPTVLKHPTDFEQLHHIFGTAAVSKMEGAAGGSGSSATHSNESPVTTVVVTRMEEVVAPVDGSAATVPALLAVLHTMWQLPTKNPAMLSVYERLQVALLDELQEKWARATRAKDREMMEHTRRLVLITVFELFRSHPGRDVSSTERAAGRKAAGARAGAKELARQREREMEESMWVGIVARATQELLIPLNSTGGGDAIQGSTSKLLTRVGLLLLGSDLCDTAQLPESEEGSLPTQWRATARRTQEAFMTSIRDTQAVVQASEQGAGALSVRLQDVLESLHLLQRLGSIFPNDFVTSAAEQCCNMVRCMCVSATGAATNPAEALQFVRLLVTPGIVSRVEALHTEGHSPYYSRTTTDIYTAVATYALAHRGDLVEMVDTAERAHRATFVAAGTAEETLPARPPLQGSTPQLCYLLLCAGYSPGSVCDSGLCSGLTPIDAVGVARACAYFSAGFAISPLPVRLHTALVQGANALIARCERDTRRLVVSSTDHLASDGGGSDSMSSGGRGSSSSLRARLTRGGAMSAEAAPFVATPTAATAAAPATTSPYAKRKKRAQGKVRSRDGPTFVAAAATATADASVVTQEDMTQLVDHTLYVCFNVLTDCLMRGDTASVSKLLLALLPLISQEGSTAVLMEALTVVTDGVRERLTVTGALDHHPLPTTATAPAATPAAGPARLHCTPLPMESALAEVTALFMPRISESILRSLGSRGTAAPTGDGTFASRQRRTTATPSPAHGGSGGVAVQLGLAHESLSRFTVAATLCGMTPNTMAQLVSIHTAVLKAGGGTADAKTAAGVVQRLDEFVTDVEVRGFGVPRHPQSAHTVTTNSAVNAVIAVQLNSSAAATAAVTSSHLDPAQHRRYTLSAVHLLFRVSMQHPVETEPAALRAFRIDILGPSLTAVMAAAAGGREVEAELSLTSLTEMAVVMCTQSTIHRVSPEFYRGLSQAVTRYMAARSSKLRSTKPVVDSTTGLMAERLLCAAASICRRANSTLTGLFLDMLTSLRGSLTLAQSMRTLDELHQQEAMTTAGPVLQMLQELVQVLLRDDERGGGASEGHSGRRLPNTTTVTILQTLSNYSVVTSIQMQVPYARLLSRLVQPQQSRTISRLSLRDCGTLVSIAAAAEPIVVLQQQRRQVSDLGPASPAMGDAGEEETLRAIREIPVTLSVPVLRASQHCAPADIPVILTGFSHVKRMRHSSGDDGLCERVMGAFISSTIRLTHAMSPEEVVECVEAYCRAGVYHQHLFGVLLSRVADVKQRVSLELSMRLLQCGITAGDDSVRTACLTASQSIFTAQVRYILHADPDMLSSVASTSVRILDCLRLCFPRDAISGAVLANIADYRHSAGLSVVQAALRLALARECTDHNTLRVLVEHCITFLIPQCSPQELADTVLLLVRCGVRSSALLAEIKTRLADIPEGELDGHTLAKLAAAMQHAYIEGEADVASFFTNHSVRLAGAYLTGGETGVAAGNSGVGRGTTAATPAGQRTPPFTVVEVSALLQLMHAAGDAHVMIAMPAVDELLGYLGALCKVGDPGSLLRCGATSPAVTAEELAGVLRACVEQASTPKAHIDLVGSCAGALEALLEGTSSGQLATTALELALTVRLASYLTRMGLSEHRATRLLLDTIYERRGVLLKRHLLLATARETLVLAGSTAHPQLYCAIVEESIL